MLRKLTQRGSVFLLTLILLMGTGISSVWADQEPLSAAAQAEEAMTTASQEMTIPGGTLLLMAYIALWAMVFGYVAFVMRRQKALGRDLEALERRMDDVLGMSDE